MNKKILYLIMFVLCFSLVSAVPRIPVQLYGSVDVLDDDTQLVISINGIEEEITSVQDSTMGVETLLFLTKDDPDTPGIEGLRGDGSDVVTFKFPGYEPIDKDYDDPSVEVYRVDITEDDLIEIEGVECNDNSDCDDGFKCKNNDCVKITGTTGGGGGSGGGSPRDRDTTLAPGFCISKWVCTGWSECVNGVQTRECVKEAPCNDSSIKPPERIACGIVEPQGEGEDNSFESQPVVTPPRRDFEEEETILIEEDKGSSLPYIIFFLILLLILVGLAFVYYEHVMTRKEIKKPYKEDKRLDKYVKETLKQGFKKSDIQKALIKKGWPKKQVNDYFYHHPELQDPGKETKKTAITSLIKKRLNENNMKDDLHKSAIELKKGSKAKGSRIKIKEYIDETLNKGYSRQDIKGALKKAGWKEEVIDKYLYEDIKQKKAVSKPSIKSSKSKIKSSGKSPLAKKIKEVKKPKKQGKLAKNIKSKGKTKSSKVKSANKKK